MADEVSENLYRIEVPLPESPLRSLNAYVIKGRGRNLVIDTGLNRPECIEVLKAGLDRLDVRLAQTDVFVTHFHADHLGLAFLLHEQGATIYLNRPDAERISRFFDRNELELRARMNGFPEGEVRKAIDNHPAFRYGVVHDLPFRSLEDGDTVNVGPYHFSCLQTPGHSFGHQCLYDARKKVFISGDHILGDITPNIQCWHDGWNPLESYLANLNRVSTFEVDLVLPGHRSIFANFQGRIEELLAHHDTRDGEVLSILDGRSMTAYEVASRMTWDIVCDSWEQFPVSQKWFAVGEAIAHLVHLLGLAKVDKQATQDRILYSVTK
jgi:glyoxylase-like metal-dependent hydrolase (beta-lactamase superfamily II)